MRAFMDEFDVVPVARAVRKSSCQKNFLCRKTPERMVRGARAPPRIKELRQNYGFCAQHIEMPVKPQS